MHATLELDPVVAPSASRTSVLRRHPFLKFLLLIAALAAPLWHLHVLNRDMPSSHSDLIDEWAGVRDAFRGQDPYSAAGMRDTQVAYYGHPLTAADSVDPQGFPYPANFVVLFAPMAILSWQATRLLFLITILPLLAIGAWLCVRSLNLSVPVGASTLIVFLYLCSWPVMWGLRLQQPTLLVAVLVFSASYLLSRDHDTPAGILMALSTIKPQLVLPLLVWFLLWTCLRRRWSFLVSFAATGILLLSLAERIMPGWFSHWVAELGGYSNFHGSLPLQFPLGNWVGLVASLTLVGWICVQLWRLRSCSPRSPEFAIAVAMANSVALCVTLTKLPTLYNQSLLLPGVLILAFAKPPEYYSGLIRRLALFLCVWGFVSLLLATAGETVFSATDFWISLPFQNILLPVLVTVALAVVASSLLDPNIGERKLFKYNLPLAGSDQAPAGTHIYDRTFYRYIQKGATRSAEVIVPLLAEHLPIDSILDVGCGAGAWLAVYRKSGICVCKGVDGDYVEASTLLIPRNDFSPRDVGQFFDLGQRFSLVQCLEVGEHLANNVSRNLVANLVRHGDCVLFSAAVPGQGGENHVNEQPYEFWRSLFAEHGYFPCDFLRSSLRADARVEPWYRHNVILYVAGHHRQRLPPAIAQTEISAAAPIPDLSGPLYRLRTSILALLPVTWLSRVAVIKHRTSLLLRPLTDHAHLPGTSDESVLQ